LEETGSLKRDIAIEVKGLSYIYSRGLPYEKEALTSVSIKIFKGEAVGIVGHTGSGKSTLIQHFNGLILPQVGTVKVFGEEIKNDKKFLKELRRKVGLVFQFPESQLFAETVYDDIAFGPRNLKLSEDEVKERVMWAIDEVGLTSEYLDRSPFSLSGGEKRRVAIAGVLSMKPEILVLDEPTAGLDPQGREEILSVVKKLKTEKDVTVIFVSHSMEDILSLVDRIFVLKEGRVVVEGKIEEVFKNKEIVELFDLSVPDIFLLGEELKEKGFKIDEPFRDPLIAEKEIVKNI